MCFPMNRTGVRALGQGKPLTGGAGHDVGDARGAVLPLVGDIETLSSPPPHGPGRKPKIS